MKKTVHSQGSSFPKEGTKKRGPAKGGKRSYVPIKSVWMLVERMHADHLDDMTLQDLERKYGYMSANIKKAFEREGMKIIDRGNRGCFAKTMKRFTKKELVALATRQTRVHTPAEIKTEWREWTMTKRAWFIALIRERLGAEGACPTTPYSANVAYFDYTTPNAQVFKKARNAGRSSHVAGCKIKPCSQGVIYDGQLWFWSPKAGYVQGVPWHVNGGRKILSHVIWERLNGPLPLDGVIRFADGNVNNLDPGNLVLATKNDIARENQAAYHQRRSRERTKALLHFQQSNEKGQTNELTGRIFSTGGSRGSRSHKAA